MTEEKNRYPETPIEVLLTALMDYAHVLEDTAKNYPEDQDVKEMCSQYKNSFADFESLVKNHNYKSYSNEPVQVIIDIFEAVEENTRACLLSGIGSYIDIVGDAVSSEDCDEQTAAFYDCLVNLFNDIAAIFSEIPNGYTYRNLLVDMFSDGYGRWPDCKVIIDSFQELLKGVKGNEGHILFGIKFYESLNPVEKNFFTENFLPVFIEKTEEALEDLEQKGETENLASMISSVVAAKKLNRQLIKNLAE